MKKELKDKWLEALRSGNYKQAKGHLRTRYNNYCCLGVLCDLVDVKWGRDKVPNGGWGVPINQSTGGGIALDMPSEEIYKQTGLDVEIATTLANLNDRGKSFNEIAQYIEEHVK